METSVCEEWRSRLFGAQLVRCRTGALEDSSVALPPAPCPIAVYFSFANISADSDPYTGELVRFYERHNAEGDGGAPRLEVVQVVLWALSDLVLDYAVSFAASLRSMPWLAVPLHDIDTKRRLSHKYRIKVGAPTLVLLNSSGAEVSRPTLDLLQHPEDYPWQPPPVHQILKGLPLPSCGMAEETCPVAYEDFPKDAVIAFYFGAHWCPPCKALGPQLAETYSLVRRRGHNFHIIYVSSDRSEESYNRTVEGMPWLRVSWGGAGEVARRELARALAVEGIPALRLMSPGGPAYDARHQAAGDPDGLNFPWKPGPVNILTEYFLGRLREHPAIVLFVDGDEEEIQFGRSVLLPAAESYFEEYRMRHPGCTYPYLVDPEEEGIEYGEEGDAVWGPGAQLQFLVGTDAEAADALRDMAALDDAVPLLTAVDFPRGRISVMALGEPITTISVQNFLDCHLSGQLPFTPLTPFPSHPLPPLDAIVPPQPQVQSTL